MNVRTFEIKRIHAGDDRYLPRLLNLRRPFYDAGAMDIVHILSRKPPTKFRLRSLAIAAAEDRSKKTRLLFACRWDPVVVGTEDFLNRYPCPLVCPGARMRIENQCDRVKRSSLRSLRDVMTSDRCGHYVVLFYLFVPEQVRELQQCGEEEEADGEKDRRFFYPSSYLLDSKNTVKEIADETFSDLIGGAVAMSSPDRHDGSSREIGVEPGESHRRRPVYNVFKELHVHIFKKDNE
ncbi:hypothetical protein ALC53_11797 [Atta colombica]|uniref:Uncharacterized protein n=1 Tax=Atta colombica TaxID=520822 RepID=A0A195B002_9HYME|nr:hypothetical protein ALC53_11797 [Atta colombica]